MEYAEARDKARAHLTEGEPQKAFAALRHHLRYPNEITDDRWSESLELLADISDAMTGAELGSALRNSASSPDDLQTLYDTSYQLYEESLFGIAAAVLSRANELAPGQPQIVAELSSSLEACRLYPAAADVLESSGLVDDEPWCGYLYVFNSILSGRLEKAKSAREGLLPSEIDDERLLYAIANVDAMLARADAVRGITDLDQDDLMGWHMAINGGILLHEASSGFADGMRGRYAYVGDSYSLLHTGIERLALVLEHAGLTPGRVIAAPDRSSRILGLATAKRLGLDLADWSEVDTQPGLFVAYDMDLVEDDAFLSHLYEHRPGQILWSHAACWTEAFGYTPDLTTYLYQVSYSPWGGGGLRFDPDSKQTTNAEPDESPEIELAQRILDAESEESHNSQDEVTALIGAIRATAGKAHTGLFPTRDSRTQQQSGSPVPSNYFG